MDNSSSYLAGSGRNTALDLVYPPICFGCNKVIDKLVCQSCWSKSITYEMPFCNICKEVLDDNLRCQKCESEKSLPIFGLGQYVDPLKYIIHQFKYNGFSILGHRLGELLVDTHQKKLNSLKLDYLAPIPLHSHRLKSRGFNQAEIMAEVMGDHLNIRNSTNVLIKTRKTKDQAKLGPDSRLTNIKGSFKVKEGIPEGKRVMVIDDVMTTGATIEEAIRVLKESGLVPVAIGIAALAGN